MIRPRVLLADDHQLILEAFTKLIETHCDVVGTVTDGRALVSMAQRLMPDVVVLDIAMPVLNGLDASRQLKQTLPNIKLIILTMNQDRELAAEALRIGALGYLLKNSAGSELLQAIQTVFSGKIYITPLLNDGMEALLDDPKRWQPASKLTLRQREVLQLLAEGRSMKEAASILSVTARTVAFHKYRMMELYGIKSNAELVRFAMKQGLIPPSSPTARLSL
jgi:DNA-binding NarL/FixJ family response regulator